MFNTCATIYTQGEVPIILMIFFFFKCYTRCTLIDSPWPENPANTCTRYTEPLDSCFNLIRCHQQCIPCARWTSSSVVKFKFCILRSLQCGGTQVFAGFSGHGNSVYNIIPLLKKRKCTSGPHCITVATIENGVGHAKFNWMMLFTFRYMLMVLGNLSLPPNYV